MIPDHIPAAKRLLLHGKLRDIGLGKVPVEYKDAFPKKQKAWLNQRGKVCDLAWGLGLLFFSCGPQQFLFASEIEALERVAFEGDSLRVDIRQSLMVKYGDFARLHGTTPLFAEALFRRADLLISAGKFDEAILQLQDVHDGYSNF